MILGMPLWGFLRCDEEEQTLNIVLYDKPIDTIKHYIQGNWKLHYGKGGIIANMVQYFENTYWEFHFDDQDRIKQTYNSNIVADTTIQWYSETDGYTGLTHIMKFFDKSEVPWNYVVVEIRNDTLIIKDFGDDSMFYHFTKQNH